MDEFAELRCKSCGASLASQPGATSLKCEYCGTVQQVIESQKYSEQAKAEMMAWMSKAIPMGYNLSQTETMDPVARHNIFMNNVKPSLEASLDEYRFGFITAVANQLIAVPFRTIAANSIKHDSKALFEFDARAKSVSALAVDDDSKKLISECCTVSTAYAMTLNNLQLVAKYDAERYHFMYNNFNSAAEALKDSERYDVLRRRFEALAKACDGMTKIMGNNSLEAKNSLSDAVELLGKVKSEAYTNIDFMSMGTAIANEIVACKSALEIAQSLLNSPEIDVTEVLKTVKNVMDEVDKEERSIGGIYSTQMKRPERNSDIFAMVSMILSSKSGEPSINVVKGQGSYYIPMWVLDLKYSFIGGSMLKKKAVEVTETVMVSAMFTTEPKIVDQPRVATTDIFKSMPETTMMQRVKGNQSSISMGGVVTQAYQSAAPTAMSSGKIIVPTSTKQEAEILCNAYMDQCKSTHPKLQMGKSTVKALVFVPCEINGDMIKLSINLDNMVPANFGNVMTIKQLAL